MSTMATSFTIWNDRFTEPTEIDLVSALGEEERELVERLLSKSEDLGADARSIRWFGIPWRWTTQIGVKDHPPIAFLIAEPGRPQISIPLSAADLDKIPMRRLSKAVREGILGARAVTNTLWPEWELTSNTQVDELLVLLRVRCEVLQSMA